WLIIATGAGDENALFDEVFQAREDGIPCVRVPWTARTLCWIDDHGSGGLLSERPRGHADGGEGATSVLVQQVVAPLDRRAKRPLACGGVHRPSGQDRKRLVQASQEGLGTEESDAGGSELDGQREPVESRADAGHGRGVLVGDLKPRPDRASSFGEEADRLDVGELVDRRCLPVEGGGGRGGRSRPATTRFLIPPAPTPRTPAGAAVAPGTRFASVIGASSTT